MSKRSAQRNSRPSISLLNETSRTESRIEENQNDGTVKQYKTIGSGIYIYSVLHYVSDNYYLFIKFNFFILFK